MNLLKLNYDSVADLKEICKPLFQTYGITYFTYSRVYDNKMATLTTMPEWREYFIKHSFQNISVIDQNDVRKEISKYKIWDAHALLYPTLADSRIHQAAKTRFNLHHGLTISRSNLNFSERFTFATHEHNYSINEYYEHSQDVFKQFTLYFKEQASSLIQLSEQHCIAYPIDLKKENKPFEVLDSNTLFKVDKFFIETFGKTTYLTGREMECIHWAFKGKSALETAIILGVSQATVKSHIFNAKQKLSATKMIDIFRILKDQDLLDVCKKTSF